MGTMNRAEQQSAGEGARRGELLRVAAVPCGSCRLCCQKSLVMILPEEGDDPEQYDTHEVPGGHALNHWPNGDCVYLGANGCMIHGRAPFMCRIYDCRAQHAMYSREQRRDMIKRGLLDKDILKRGAVLRKAGSVS